MPERRPPADDRAVHVLRAAARVFAEKGYHRASIRDVAEAAGLSLAGLYYYVGSKAELLFRIQDHAFATLLATLEQELAGRADPVERFHVFVDQYVRFFAANLAEMKVLSHEADALGGRFRAQIQEHKRRLARLVDGLLTELRPHAEVDRRAATFALFGMLNWIYTWYRPDRDEPPERLAADFARLFLHGYLTESAPAPAFAAAEPGSVWDTALNPNRANPTQP